MATMVRKCEQCGTIDRKHTWKSADEASAQGAYEASWACGSCAWTEFDIVPDEGAQAQQPAESEQPPPATGA